MLDKETSQYLEIVNSTSIVNQKIISLLGYNYDIFLLSNFCEQKKLSYFSELKPAKRIQYIDKISGIEEAKELTKHLMVERKRLKDSIALLKDVTKEPILNPNIKLDFDYEKEIDSFRFIYAANSLLPPDIRILSCEKVSSDFHAQDCAPPPLAYRFV